MDKSYQPFYHQADTAVDKYNILYVDDEEVNLRVFKYAFQKDYNVLTAVNGAEALEVMKDHEIHLIITDQRMPSMTGVDLLKRVVPKHPQIIRMIMTGFSDVGVLIDAVNDIGINKYLRKPWDRDDLKSTIDYELERSYGLSAVKINPEGLVNEENGLQENILFTQNKFLKSCSEIKRFIGKSCLIRSSTNTLTGKLHWIGGDALGQKIVVMINTHLQGSQGSTLIPALYQLVDNIVDKEDKVFPTRLLLEIEGQLRGQGFEPRIAEYTTNPTGICVLALDEEQLSASYASNYQAIKVMDSWGITPQVNESGSFDLININRMFICSEGFSEAEIATDKLENLLTNSAQMVFSEQCDFLKRQMSGQIGGDSSANFTLLCLDTNGYNSP